MVMDWSLSSDLFCFSSVFLRWVMNTSNIQHHLLALMKWAIHQGIELAKAREYTVIKWNKLKWMLEVTDVLEWDKENLTKLDCISPCAASNHININLYKPLIIFDKCHWGQLFQQWDTRHHVWTTCIGRSPFWFTLSRTYLAFWNVLDNGRQAPCGFS